MDLYMDKVNDASNPTVARFVKCTPSQLRLIADRIEASTKNAVGRERISYQLADGIVLFYEFRQSESALTCDISKTETPH